MSYHNISKKRAILLYLLTDQVWVTNLASTLIDNIVIKSPCAQVDLALLDLPVAVLMKYCGLYGKWMNENMRK